jgi:membrane associated rhomboid family serine protease
MGIYDREYYREGSRGFGWLANDWPAWKILIAINVAAFLCQTWLIGDAFTDLFDGRASAIEQKFQIWRLLTCAFLHADVMHLLFNMLFLWFAGKEVELIYGRREFTLMYLTAAVVSTLVWLIVENLTPGTSTVGPPRDASMIGASGAVMAVLVLFATYYPNREVLLFFVLSVPIWLFVLLYVGADVLRMLQEMRNGSSDSMVAFAAHVGGAAYGFLYRQYDLQWARLPTPSQFLRRRRLKVYRPESSSRWVKPSVSASSRAAGPKSSSNPLSPMAQFPDEHLDAKVDEILAKIAREGRGGLSDEENRILEEASLRARHRRGHKL